MGSKSATATQINSINPRYDSQHTYDAKNSYYGDGKYPPDWDARREEVWERQKYQCGRCGVYKGDTDVSEVHHIVHLSDGGSNSLDNLIGLCNDCHAAMHPNLDAMSGDATQADVFPSEYADNRVSVIREPDGNKELKFDVQRLSEFSEPGENQNAITKITIPTSPKIARQAGQSLQDLLLNKGYVPRTSSYHRVGVHPQPVDLLAAISSQSIDLTTRSDGSAFEVEDSGDGSNIINIYYSHDSTNSEIEIIEPTGDTSKKELSLDHISGSRLRVEKPVHAPALTAETAPKYAVGAAKYFGWQSLKIGAIPGIILALIFPSYLPAGESLFGMVMFVIIIGLVIRMPSIYEDATSTPEERVIDERQNETT